MSNDVILKGHLTGVHENEDGDWIIEGEASNGFIDDDGQSISQEGMDVERLDWLNYDHKSDAKYLVGEIIDRVKTPTSLLIKGLLYKEQPQAQDIWHLANILEKGGYKNRLGFSIEGRRTDGKKDNVITRSRMFKVSICPTPVNPKTLAKIKKSYDGENIKEVNELIDNYLGKTSKKSTKNIKKSAIIEKFCVIFDKEFTKSYIESYIDGMSEQITGITADVLKGIIEEVSESMWSKVMKSFDEMQKSDTPDKEDDSDDDDDDKGKDDDKDKEPKDKSKKPKEKNKEASDDKEIDKSIVVDKEEDSMNAEDIAKAFGPLFGELKEGFNTQLEEIKKSITAKDDIISGLQTELESVKKSSTGARAVVAKSYSERFPVETKGDTHIVLNRTSDREVILGKLDAVAKSYGGTLDGDVVTYEQTGLLSPFAVEALDKANIRISTVA